MLEMRDWVMGSRAVLVEGTRMPSRRGLGIMVLGGGGGEI
jgi:hypothetical protein